MFAKDALDGQVYNLAARGSTRPQYKGAICSGWNHTHEWILFVVRDEWGTRKMVMVFPNEEVGAL